jgi:hypothetical protein
MGIRDEFSMNLRWIQWWDFCYVFVHSKWNSNPKPTQEHRHTPTNNFIWMQQFISKLSLVWLGFDLETTCFTHCRKNVKKLVFLVAQKIWVVTLILTSTILQCTSSHHVFQNLVGPFCLSISLGMISRTEIQLCSQRSMYLVPELWSKLSTSIRRDLLSDPMQAHYSFHVQLY